MSVDKEGTTVLGSTGQVRVHPALGELRQHRLAPGRLLAQLGLPDADDASLKSPSHTRASKAAQTRWRAHNTQKAANGWRRSIEPPAGDESALVLPRELADNTGLTAEEYRAFWKARNAWFRAHGIDPGDWSAVYPVPKA